MNYTRPKLKLERAKLLIKLEQLDKVNHHKSDALYLISEIHEVNQLLKEHTNK